MASIGDCNVIVLQTEKDVAAAASGAVVVVWRTFETPPVVCSAV